MSGNRRTLGFDRKIQLDWLDATAEWAGQGRPVGDVRVGLEQFLEGKIAGEGPHSARGKTITVLLHVWLLVPQELVALRDEGLAHLRERTVRDRLPMHWGMCVATYPFFRHVAMTTGRLLALQGTAALSQIVRRATETWGERSTVRRAAQRIVRSFVQWGVLGETGERGVFAASPRLVVNEGDAIGPWIAEAMVTNGDRRARSVRSLQADPSAFPFELYLSARELARRPRLEVYRQGLDEEVVTLRGGR